MHQTTAAPKRGSSRRRVPPRPKPCATGKRPYRDHEQAIDALHRAETARHRAESRGHATRRRETRAYECPICGRYHLTSQVAR